MTNAPISGVEVLRPRRKRIRPYNDERQVVCVFDEETFAEIDARAKESKISFRAQVRLLVEFGLEDVRESGASSRR